MNIIQIENDGQKIVNTNYWGSDYDKQGMFYVTPNAGAIRLLCPSNFNFKELKGTKEVIISRGIWRDQDLEGTEIMFEDESNNPFCLKTSLAQWETLPIPEDQHRKLVFAVWKSGRKVKEWPCYYRIVDYIPCLQKYNGPK